MKVKEQQQSLIDKLKGNTFLFLLIYIFYTHTHTHTHIIIRAQSKHTIRMPSEAKSKEGTQ